jgi:type 2 lantibiotic biosynthesis protein LanM
MVETDFEPIASCLLPGSAWRRAATLVERVRFIRGAGDAWHVQNDGQRDVERSRRRLEEWRAQEPFSRSALFQERLAQAGLTEAELMDLLSEPAEAAPSLCELCEQNGDLTIADGELPAWVKKINQAFTSPMHLDLPAFPETVRDKPACGFLELIRPLMGRAVAQLREGVGRLAGSAMMADYGTRHIPFDPETVIEILFAPLPSRLLDMLLRTMTLELNVARLQGLLPGETPEERFQSFVKRLQEPEIAIQLLREYPVLARQVVTWLDNWLAVSLEFLERWCADWPGICAALSLDQDPGPLVEIEADAGDSHRAGRSVWIAKCRSGFQAVYKPKSMAVDRHFQQLLGWLNERGASPPFKQIKILDRGSHGWAEFVSASACAAADQVERFYRREGGYLALLYALAANDFHYENVIAAGEEPILIDLETIFHPQERESYVKPADHLAGNALDESVLGSMLLPQPMRLDFDGQALDMSGMAAEPGRELPWRYPGFLAQGTDEMHFARKTDVIASSDHRPTLNGAAVQPLDYATAIEAGFRHVYELLTQHRDELLGPDGPLQHFAPNEVRVILHATSQYREFLDEGSHPDVLRDALDRDRLFDRLWEGIEEQPGLARFIRAEVEDLWRGDIPFFATRPDSHDLWSSTGQRFTDEFGESGMDRVRRRLTQFGATDLARQLWFLRASLATLTTGLEASAHPGYRLVEDGPAADRERLLAAACAVGDWLAEHAIHGLKGDVNWLGLTLVRDEQWSFLPLAMDLYDGVPGVTLFLAYLGAITTEERYTSLARAALQTLRRRLLPHKRLKTVQCLGGFAGWGGVLYTLTHLGALWNEPEILGEAQDLVSVLPDLIKKDKYFDVGLGAAGCIAGLLCLERCATSPRIIATASQCGDHLLAHARAIPPLSPAGRGQSEGAIAWQWPWPSRGPLAGYSHGAAGIAWALLELASRAGEERFHSAAQAAIAYERSLFSAEAGNWPDLRLFGQEAVDAPLRYPTTWCYGAPGIGLARLRCLPHLDDPMLYEEIGTGLRTTQANGFGLSHILCHGDLGNLELLMEAAHVEQREEKNGRKSFRDARPESQPREKDSRPLFSEIERLAAGILNGIKRAGWLCANPMNLESPGLMTGIAGIGYQLLRLAEPDKVPSVLTLAPPAGW